MVLTATPLAVTNRRCANHSYTENVGTLSKNFSAE